MLQIVSTSDALRDGSRLSEREAYEEDAATEIRAFYGNQPAPLPDGVAPIDEAEMAAADREWRPAGATSHDVQLARAVELVAALLAMVDEGWIEVRRFDRLDSDDHEVLSRDALRVVLSDPAIWDWWYDSAEPALALVFTEHGAQLWRTDWADEWFQRLRVN